MLVPLSLHRATLAALSSLFLYASIGVRAQTTSARCLSQYAWMFNSKGQSPCRVASYLGGACHPTQSESAGKQFHVRALRKYQQYGGPGPGEDDECKCSSVYYSLMSACGTCQNGVVMQWSSWIKNCTTSSVGIWPKQIPSGTAIPAWGYMNITKLDKFDPGLAQLLETLPDMTAPRPTTKPAQSTPKPAMKSSSTNEPPQTSSSVNEQSESSSSMAEPSESSGSPAIPPGSSLHLSDSTSSPSMEPKEAVYSASPPGPSSPSSGNTGPTISSSWVAGAIAGGLMGAIVSFLFNRNAMYERTRAMNTTENPVFKWDNPSTASDPHLALVDSVPDPETQMVQHLSLGQKPPTRPTPDDDDIVEI